MIGSAEEAAQRPGVAVGSPRWTLAATIAGSSMALIDGAAVNVALPILQSDFHATIGDAQWVVNAYMLVLSAFILAGGALGDRVGIVRVFALGVVLFTAASIACGLAPGVGFLIGARAAQGAGAALLVPESLAIITAVFPAKTRGAAIGTWSALTSVAIIAGPVLGGVLVQTVSWRAIFFINVPLALFVLWVCYRRLPRIAGHAGGPIDIAGTLLITAALGAITWSLIEAPTRGGALPAVAAVSGVVCFVAFVFVERRATAPLVPLSLFRSRAFSGANILTLFLYAAMSGVMFLLPFELISIRHYTPGEAGAAFLPIMATMSLLSRFTGALADRIGARPLLIVGPIVVGCGLVLLAMSENGASYWTAFMPGLIVMGIGMATTVAPLTTTVMTALDDERAGVASGVNNAVARAAGLLAIAVFGAAAVILFSRELDRRLAAHNASPALRRQMASRAQQLANAAPPAGADRAMAADSIHAAFQKAFAVDMFGAAALAIVSGAGAVVIGPKRRKV